MLPHKLPEPILGMGIVSYDGGFLFSQYTFYFYSNSNFAFYLGLIYIVGGRNEQLHSSLISFNPVTGEWETLAPMLIPRIYMGVAVLDSHLYVVGGTMEVPSNLVEKYSFCEVRF